MKKIIYSSLILMLHLFCLPSLVSGTYYVSPASTSIDWSAARDIDTPCTVQTAFDNAQAGDIVQFRGGVYTVPQRNTGTWLTGYYAPNYSGTEEARIIFMAYPGETPVFDGTSGGSADYDGHGYGHFASIMSNARYDAQNQRHIFNEYITFDGFTFQTDGGINEARIPLTGGDNFSTKPRIRGLVIQNCIFNGGTWDNEPRINVNGVYTGTGDNHEGIFVSQTTGLIIRNCKLFEYVSANNNLNTSAIKTYHSDHISIENCEIFNSSMGIFSKTNTDDLMVKYCYIHHCNSGFYVGTGGWWNDPNDHTKGYHVNENSNNVLCNNLFVNNNRGTISGLTQGGGDLDGFSVYNNTIYGGTGYTASVGLGSGERQQYYNNIQYGPKIDNDIGLLKWYCGNNDPDAIAEGMAEFNFGLDVCDHNQFSDLASNFLIRIKKPNESTVSYSTLQIWQTSGVLTDGSNPGEGSLASNPLFVNGSGAMNEIADFALRATSPCKGAGRDGVDMGADISRVGVQIAFPGDIEAPSVPEELTATRVSGAQVDLSWSASTDNVGVNGYRVYRNGDEIGTSMELIYTDSTAASGINYNYTVAAYDESGNESGQSAVLSVTTGHEYYVAPGGNDTNAGTIDAPWATPEKAWYSAQSGDIVNFRNGDYTILSSVNTKYSGYSGTHERRITFTNYPGEHPVIRANSIGYILLLEKDYWIIDGLEFVMDNILDSDRSIIRLGYDVHAHNTIIQNCKFQLLGAQGRDNISCIMLHGGHANYCLIKNNYMIGFNVAPYAALANPGASAIQYLGLGNIGSKVLNNVIHNFSLGIYVKHANADTAETGAEIAYNYIYNTCNGIHGNPVYINIHDNLLVGIDIAAGDNGGGPQGHHNTINHNTIYNGGLFFDHPSEGPITDCTVKNNIFMKRIALNPYSYGNSTPHNTVLDYNMYLPDSSAFLEYSVNYSLDSWRVHYGGDEHSICGTPIFVGGNAPTMISNFALATGSPGKGAASDGKDMGADVNQVGVQSDLPADIEAPSVPTDLAGTAVSQTQIDLTWTPSTDNVEVTGYNIYRDGILIDTCVDTSYSNVDLAPGTVYDYAVSAFDAAENESVLSSSISVSTLSDENNILYLNPAGDTFINLNTDNNSSSQNLNLYTWPVNQVANSILIKWGTGSIPSNIIITEAKLRLYMTGTESNEGDELYDVSVHRIINHDPNITMATGYSFDGTNEWTANSACYDNIPMAQADIATAESTIQIDKNPGYKEWNVLGMVNYWIAHPDENYGMLINSDTSASEDSNRIFASLEHPDSNSHPVIVIKYQQSGNNNIPVITPVPSITKYEGELIEISIDVTDPDNSDTITVSSDNMPAGASLIKIADKIWQFTWQTDFASAGIYTVTLIANDGKAHSEAVTIELFVNDVNSNINLTDKPGWFKDE